MRTSGKAKRRVVISLTVLILIFLYIGAANLIAIFTTGYIKTSLTVTVNGKPVNRKEMIKVMTPSEIKYGKEVQLQRANGATLFYKIIAPEEAEYGLRIIVPRQVLGIRDSQKRTYNYIIKSLHGNEGIKEKLDIHLDYYQKKGKWWVDFSASSHTNYGSPKREKMKFLLDGPKGKTIQFCYT